MEGDPLFEDSAVFCLLWSFSQRLSLQPPLALLIPLESLRLTVSLSLAQGTLPEMGPGPPWQMLSDNCCSCFSSMEFTSLLGG